VDGSICVENYHAILENVKSSIRDSLEGKGARVAVLNDETHHVANAGGKEAKKWKAFLRNPDYGFRIVVGVSGTCYVGDEYFADGVHRYSLRQAIEERFVKKVEYIAEMPETGNAGERWQLIYKRHTAWKKKLKTRKIRPLTIIVTRDIRSCEQVAEELKEFLVEWEDIFGGTGGGQGVALTSSARHHQTPPSSSCGPAGEQGGVDCVVSMLSEGWDVKNVFQIVPHEERAFNSKLLIAQVLGRGLRRPEGWQGEDPMVTVFNHDAWSGRIRHLVNEILEIERRLTSRVDAASQWNFELHHLDYTRDEDTSEYAKKGEYRLLEEGFVDLPAQVEAEDVTIEFERAVTGEHVKFKTEIQHKTWSAEAVAEQMFQRLKSIDEESKDADDPKDRTAYAKKFPLPKCEAIVRESLKRAEIKHGRITDENRQNSCRRWARCGARRPSGCLQTIPKALVTLNTGERQAESCSAAELRGRTKRVFYPPDCEATLEDEQKEFFRELEDPDGDFGNGREPVANAADFKTPANLVIADATPERKFVRELCNRDYAAHVDAWLKNTPMGFYAIEYAWKKGEHPKRSEFSPDFFIKQGDWVFVVEIKDDSEIREPLMENIKKHEYARAHFDRLNHWLEKAKLAERYQFNMLSPQDYGKFFTKLRQRDLVGFRSELDVAITRLSR
jgi:type III restriction enzyme